MTAKTVADLVFQNLGDTGTTTKWSRLAEVIPAIARAQRAMRTDHPEAFITAAGAWATITDPTADASTVAVNENWLERLAALTTARLLLGRYSDKENVDKAQVWLNIYAGA